MRTTLTLKEIPACFVWMTPRTAPAGAVVSNALNAPITDGKVARGSPIWNSWDPDEMLMFCARVLVGPGVTSVVGFQSVPSYRWTIKFAVAAPASTSPARNLKVASMSAAALLIVVEVNDQ